MGLSAIFYYFYISLMGYMKYLIHIAYFAIKMNWNYGSADQQPLDRLSLAEVKALYAKGQFPAGSMGPKVLSAIRFLEFGGKKVVISNIESGGLSLQGKTGTTIVP